MADNRKVQLTLSVKAEGAEKASQDIQSIANGATSLQKELGRISRGDQIARIGSEMGALAKQTKNVGAAVADLNKQLKELGASDDEIRDAANAFASAQGGGPSNRLGRIGSELRALPSTQIPGLPISSDQIASLIRLGGAIGVVGEKAAGTSAIAQKLTPYLGETAAGLAGIALQAAPFVIATIAIAAAVKSASDEVQKSADAINNAVDAQRELNERIREGATSKEIEDELKVLEQQKKDEQKIYNDASAAYQDYEKTTRDAITSNKDLGLSLTGVLIGVDGTVAATKVLRADEEALFKAREDASNNVSDTEAKITKLKNALEDGKFAANDAAEAEKKLAEERSKNALSSADTAGKELQAQQRALNATEEQNKKRLETIKEEQAVAELQIKTLEESGVTSEEVTAKIAALNGQLGSLGKESDFITKTALEASRQADAAKKAQKDAEDAAKKAEQAQIQYTKSVDAAGKQYTQSLQDIGTRSRQIASDNELKFNRDVTDIATKYRRDEFDLEIKANRAERDAAQDQIKDLRKIKEDGNKQEQEALREGDFKALFLARQQQKEALQEQESTLDDGKRQRQQDAQDAREDLLRNAQRQRQDRMLGYDRQLVDARTAQDRELAQARLTQQRAVMAASEALNAELAIRGQYWNAVIKQTQQALGVIQGGMTGGGTTTRTAGTFSNSFAASLSKVVAR